MRIGVVVLPQFRAAEAAARWRALDDMGFDHAWTYDHLAWRDLAEEPWFGTVPVLAHAAASTSRIRLGTWVASPNFRHPVPFAKDLMTLDDLSGGRFVLGVGAGGTGWDAEVLGAPVLAPGQRIERLAEFLELLDLLLTQPETTWSGAWFTAVRARMHPGGVQAPRLPFVVAANAPRGMRLAARFGQGWATTGPETDDRDAWWAGVRRAVDQVEEAVAATGRTAPLARYLSVDTPDLAVSSAAHFADVVGRARDLGFTDVVTHWPRPDGVYGGDDAVLAEVGADLDALRAD